LIIRRAIGPVACEITSSRDIFVDPAYPQEDPREGKSKLLMIGGASGTSALATQKIIKKLTPQFSCLFHHFSMFVICSINSEQFWVKSGTPLGPIFRFFGMPVLFSFSVMFQKFQKKNDKWKVLKALRLCIDLGGCHVEKIMRCFEKCIDFLVGVSQKIMKSQDRKREKHFPSEKLF